MFKLEPEPSELRSAAIVAETVQLSDVRFSRIAAQVAADKPHSRRMEPSIEFDARSYSLSENNLLQVRVELSFVLQEKHEEPGKPAEPWGRINLEAIAEYKTPPGPIPEAIKSEGLPAFAKYNGLYNCWPYLRQQLQMLTVTLGLPPYVLPTLVIRAKKSQGAEVVSPVEGSTKKARATRPKGGGKKKP